MARPEPELVSPVDGPIDSPIDPIDGSVDGPVGGPVDGPVGGSLRVSSPDLKTAPATTEPPLDFDHADQLLHQLTADGKLDQAMSLLVWALQSNLHLARKNLKNWVRFLSLLHALGNVQNSCGLAVEAAQSFAAVCLLGTNTISVDDLFDPQDSAPDPSVVLSVGSLTDHTVKNDVGILDLDHEPSTRSGMSLLISHILTALYRFHRYSQNHTQDLEHTAIISYTLLQPRDALRTRFFVFRNGQLPTPDFVEPSHIPGPVVEQSKDQPFSSTHYRDTLTMDIVVSVALLNLGKMFQDGVSSGDPSRVVYLNGKVSESYQVICLYILSMSLNPSPSTANNIGILLASTPDPNGPNSDIKHLAQDYYRHGLVLDPVNPHLLTNLGSLFREQGRVKEAVDMYERAVEADPHFSIALANLAGALKDQNKVDLAADYYKRALDVNPGLIEALVGLANTRGSVCDWVGRGGGGWEPWSVDDSGQLVAGHVDGWLPRILETIRAQIETGRSWGCGAIQYAEKYEDSALFNEVAAALSADLSSDRLNHWRLMWKAWSDQPDEGINILTVVENVMRMCQRRWYLDRQHGIHRDSSSYPRPRLPGGLPVPHATDMLPFHAFMMPFDAYQIKSISERCANRISILALSQPWLPRSVYPPPAEPGPLKVGYVSSDFVNHPLAHLMQSVFGMHDKSKVLAYGYATSPSDESSYRKTIEQGCHVFRDVSFQSTQAIVDQIVQDGIHILVNLNGFTRGARNDIFAVRPCPVQIALMGFAGPINSGWCDYIVADRTAIPPDPMPQSVYREKVLYMPDSFFVCDHRQSAVAFERAMTSEKKASSSAQIVQTVTNNSNTPSWSSTTTTTNTHSWSSEKTLRKRLRNLLFPSLPNHAVLLANFNQLYKINPTTFKMWLTILEALPEAYLWLLQFPASGQANLYKCALAWAGKAVADRLIFTPVVEKEVHIFRSRICDLFLDTPECNAHTTAADVLWAATPMLTFPRHYFKLCSRIGASIVRASLPDTDEGKRYASRLVVDSDQAYMDRAVEFGRDFVATRKQGDTQCELDSIREVLFEHRVTGRLFDTRKWVANLEKGLSMAWNDWVEGRHEHIYV